VQIRHNGTIQPPTKPSKRLKCAIEDGRTLPCGFFSNYSRICDPCFRKKGGEYGERGKILLNVEELEERIAPSVAPGQLGYEGQPGNQGNKGGGGNGQLGYVRASLATRVVRVEID
jgi:hypothetical protein